MHMWHLPHPLCSLSSAAASHTTEALVLLRAELVKTDVNTSFYHKNLGMFMPWPQSESQTTPLMCRCVLLYVHLHVWVHALCVHACPQRLRLHLGRMTWDSLLTQSNILSPCLILISPFPHLSYSLPHLLPYISTLPFLLSLSLPISTLSMQAHST